MASKKHTANLGDINHIIGYRLRSSILLLGNELVDLLKHEEWPSPFVVPESIIGVRKRVSELFCQIDGGNSFGDGVVDELYEIKQTLHDIGDSIESIRLTIECIMSSADEKRFESEPKKYGLTENLARIPDFFHYLTTNKDMRREAEYMCMAAVISCIPMRMTKERYSRYISESFEGYVDDVPSRIFNHTIKRCELIAAVKPHPALTGHEQLLNSAMELWASFFTKKGEPLTEDDELRLDELDDLGGNLEEINTYLDTLLNACNILISVIMKDFKPSDLDSSLLAEKDAYYTARGILLGEYDAESFDGAFSDLVGDLIDSINLEAQSLVNTFKKPKSKNEKALESDKEEFEFYMYMLLLFDEALGEARVPKIDNIYDIVSESEQREIVSGLNRYILETLKQYPNGIQKAKRRQIMEHIDCPFDVKEFLDYIKYNIDDASDAARSFLEDRLGSLYEIYGYGDDEYDDETESDSDN